MKNYKITKIQKLEEVCNSMCHNFYYLAFFRLYNDDNTRYKKGKFIVWVDAFDVQEYFDKDSYTKKDVETLVSDLAVNTMETYYKDYNDTHELYEYCRQTILDHHYYFNK